MTKQREVSLRDPSIRVVAYADATPNLQVKRPKHALRESDSSAVSAESVIGWIWILIVQVRITFSITSRTRGVVKGSLFLGVVEIQGAWRGGYIVRGSILGPSIVILFRRWISR